MKIPARQLIHDLKKITEQNLQFVESLSVQPEVRLNLRLSEESWSILECFEHLNLYGRFYLPEIGKRLKNQDTKAAEFFNPGILGNYFVKSMLPKENINKMKTLFSMNPIHSQLDKRVLTEFISQQKQMIQYLNETENVNLNTVKTGISISRLVKLKLGDTLRFVVYHNLRHIEQAKKILNTDLQLNIEKF
ncbi:DinB family protein [Chryseobacterium gregarium]|uniref:DinB family protein n=1 Tax=Chryseobacterium gregarium TaxID=456299 RepID=UPI00041DB16D|nr:DinB family protein [Chryseobacterium gregarium]